MKKTLLIILIFVFAIALRLVKLDTIPIELFGDELDAGYQAYSILNTGKDIRGYKFPLYFHSLSESKAPVYLYSTVPFVAIFGLNVWGVRLPGVVFGLLGILLLYLLTKKLFSDRKVTIFALILISILPWHLQYSRAALEETLLMALSLGGIYFFTLSLKRNYLMLLSILFFILSIYTYPTAVIFTPIIFIVLILIFKDEIIRIRKKPLFCSITLICLGSIPFLVGFFNTGQSQDRFLKISIFNDQKSIDQIITKRIPGTKEERIFHNKLIQYGSSFLDNYLVSFSPQFLFLSGDPAPRHNSGQGQFPWPLAPFLILGLFEIFLNLKDKKYKFLLIWLLVSPIPSALTADGANHAGRLFLMIPPLIATISLGLAKLFNNKSRMGIILKILVISLLVINFIFYLHQYYVHYSKDSWQYWQYGYKGAIEELRKVDQNYNRVIINNNHDPILLRFIFWGKISPLWFRDNFIDDKIQIDILPEFNGFKLSKYYFGGLKDRKYLGSLLNSQTLYLAFQGDEIPGDWDWEKNPPEGVRVLKVIREPQFNQPYIYLLTGK